MGNFGPGEMLMIAVVALLLFGPRRLPEIARSVGKAVREFKKATSEFSQELTMELEQPASHTPPKPASAGGDEPRPGPRA
ncbi:MAG: twin-arginine translocase TatA/TatE family subunit [Actinomycetota bacterium]|nr:twin-arginine translocase TatA/TatE family subunit [Actinomycetota bacterium]